MKHPFSAQGFAEYERCSPILTAINEKCDPEEKVILKRAALALLFSTLYYREELEEFLKKFEPEESETAEGK